MYSISWVEIETGTTECVIWAKVAKNTYIIGVVLFL